MRPAKRGVLAALTRLRVVISYYTSLNRTYKGDLRRELRAIESELRVAPTDDELTAILSCATYTETAVKYRETQSVTRTEYFNKQSAVARNYTKRAMNERGAQQRREDKQRGKK